MRKNLLVLSMVLAFGTARAEQTLAGLPWSYTGPPDKEATARRVVETLRRLCPRIDQALPDFESFEAEFRRLPPFHTRYREGYRVMIEGGPVLANRHARVMPSPPFDPEDHTLFEVFGPPKPGIAMDKPTALWLCNAAAPEPGGITFVPIPELGFIGR